MKIKMPKIEVNEIAENESIIAVEPLDKGLGHTLGNAMRRVLLSDLPGAAAVGVKIAGVLHEFSTIPGVAEDVVDILLNLKGVFFRALSPSGIPEGGESFVVRLRREKPGVVLAKDLECGIGVEVMNPDHPICTLGEIGRIDMEIFVGVGRGYRDAKENKVEGASIGYIPMDSIFTPVLGACYEVESARVGPDIDYDRLLLKVKTNGTVTGREVVSFAAKVLDDHIKMFIGLCDKIGEMDSVLEKAEEAKEDDLARISIEDMDFSVRAYNCLKRGGLSSLKDLVGKTEGELLRLRNFGLNSLSEVKLKLAERNLRLREDEDRSEK